MTSREQASFGHHAMPDEDERHDPLDGMPLARRPILAIFGGSFDPVHHGHIALAQEIIASEVADEVLFVPARKPPHKASRELTSGKHRLEMLKLAIVPTPEFSVSDIELERGEGFSYTFDTMTVLRQVFPEHELRFLMGMDSLRDLHLWHRAGELVQHFRFIIYPRPACSCPSLAELSDRFGNRNARQLLASVQADLPQFPFSATEVREAIASGQEPEQFCPADVCRYIESHGLYGCPSHASQQE